MLRTPYTKYKAVKLTLNDKISRFSEMLEKVVSPKYKELKEIFKEEGKEIEWERIVQESKEDYDDFGALGDTLESKLVELDLLRYEIQDDIIKKCKTA